MSLIFNEALIGAAGQGGAYQIEQSLRFDGSGPSRLTYDNTSGTNNSSSAWTLSFWMKRGDPISSSPYGNDLHLMMWTPSGSCANTEYFLIADPNHGNTTIQNGMSFNGGGYSGNIANKLRDPSAWYHFVWRGNTGSSTNIVYINGVPVTAYHQGPSSMTSSLVNGATRWSIGDSYTGCSSSPWEGYLAEVHFVDGQALTADSFGEFDDNGVWRPIRYTGTYGTNGYYLKFDPSAANGVGHDHSGNGHHWTASSVTTSGTGTDVLDDTPTNNFPTFNPLALERGLNQGNLVVGTGHGNGDFIWTKTMAANQGGNYYWEYNITSVQASSDFYFGVLEYSDPIHRLPDWAYGVRDKTLAFNTNTNNIQWLVRGSWVNSNAPSGGFTVAVNDVVGVRLDIDNDLITLSKNGTVQTGLSGYLNSDTSVYYTPATDVYGNNDQLSFNAGQRAFSHQPSGTTTLCTANLATPDVANPGEYFKTLTYTGTGGTRTVSGAGFQPDFAWIKCRSTGSNHVAYDVLRGIGRLRPDDTDSEFTTADGFASFASDGLNLDGTGGGGGDVNVNGRTYVAWCWKAGGSGSSNTAGTITSTVSANPSAGFSVVTYTGNATSNATVGHGLGVAADVLIVKNRSSSNWWKVYHQSLGIGYYINLNDNYAASNSSVSSIWGSSAPSSTVFSLGSGSDGSTNSSGNNYVAYCFAEKQGYSRFGSYTGNGDSTDGTFVYTGFKPAMIITKMSSGADNWNIYDNVRNTYNPVSQVLYPDLQNTEDTLSNSVDFLSNGFKVGAYANNSNATYIFMAFAESPFGGDGVSPTTAR